MKDYAMIFCTAFNWFLVLANICGLFLFFLYPPDKQIYPPADDEHDNAHQGGNIF